MKLQIALGCTIVTAALAGFQSRDSSSGRQPIQPTPGAAEPFRVGGGVPQGYMILGNSPASPPGYEFTGLEARANSAQPWVLKSAMPFASVRVHHTALASEGTDGRMYIVGGFNGSTGEPLDDIIEYNPATDSWTQIATIPTPRIFASAALCGNVIYFIGGGNMYPYSSRLVEAYDIDANSWSTKAQMPTARGRMATVSLNGKVYAMGGEGAPTSALAFEEYDPLANSWQSKAPMLSEKSRPFAVVANDKIYVVGSLLGASSSIMEEYDPANQEWRVVTTLLSPRWDAAACALNNRIYVFGGTYDYYLPIVEAYDLLTGTWGTETYMSSARSGCGAATLNGHIYLTGGSFGPSATNRTEEFVPGSSLYVHRKL